MNINECTFVVVVHPFGILVFALKSTSKRAELSEEHNLSPSLSLYAYVHDLSNK